MRISDLQTYVKEFCAEKGFNTTSMEQRTLYLMTEVGEMTKELLHLSYHPDHEQKDEIKHKLGLEMFDVVWNLVELANRLEIDLEKAFQEKMDINKDRVWK